MNGNVLKLFFYIIVLTKFREITTLFRNCVLFVQQSRVIFSNVVFLIYFSIDLLFINLIFLLIS